MTNIILTSIFTFVFIFLIVLMVFAWFKTIYYLGKAMSNSKEGVSLWRDLYLNPFNVIMKKEFLNDKGVSYRVLFIKNFQKLFFYAVLSAVILYTMKQFDIWFEIN